MRSSLPIRRRASCTSAAKSAVKGRCAREGSEMLRRLTHTVGLLMLCLPVRLMAGSEAGGASHFTPEAIGQFAKSVEHYAAEAGARAFIIARQGRPESELPDGIRFTHTAIAIYSTVTTADGRQLKGYAIHNLYQKSDK